MTAIGAEPHVIYVAGPDHFLLWYHFYVYSEANGVAGLQRGGPSVLTGDFDACQDSASPDAFVAFA